MRLTPDGAWSESVAVVAALADGDKAEAAQIVRTSGDPELVTDGLLHVLSALMRLAGPEAGRLVEFCRMRPAPPPIPVLSGSN